MLAHMLTAVCLLADKQDRHNSLDAAKSRIWKPEAVRIQSMWENIQIVFNLARILG